MRKDNGHGSENKKEISKDIIYAQIKSLLESIYVFS